MKIQVVKLSDIFPYYNNPRDNANAVAPVRESLERFGFIKPIMVDRNKVIICGHTRYVAAYQAGCQFVPIVVSDMPEEQAKRFRILDNKIAEKSSFNEDELIEELKKMQAPTEMQAFFFEDIDKMINFSYDQFNQQVSDAGGFGDAFFEGESEPFATSTAPTEPVEEFEDPADGLYQEQTREDGTQFMKVVCPYCGNIEEIEID